METSIKKLEYITENARIKMFTVCRHLVFQVFISERTTGNFVCENF
jgi:hypothetical protein